jgi:hypothetical protein
VWEREREEKEGLCIWRILHSKELLMGRKWEVVPVLPLTEHHTMKAYWGSGGTDSPIL